MFLLIMFLNNNEYNNGKEKIMGPIMNETPTIKAIIESLKHIFLICLKKKNNNLTVMN